MADLVWLGTQRNRTDSLPLEFPRKKLETGLLFSAFPGWPTSQASLEHKRRRNWESYWQHARIEDEPQSGT
jgi:hypothetical protein